MTTTARISYHHGDLRAAFNVGSLLNASVKEASELLPRYREDNIFDSTKFANRYPDFTVTSYRDGITQLLTPSRAVPGNH